MLPACCAGYNFISNDKFDPVFDSTVIINRKRVLKHFLLNPLFNFKRRLVAVSGCLFFFYCIRKNQLYFSPKLNAAFSIDAKSFKSLLINNLWKGIKNILPLRPTINSKQPMLLSTFKHLLLSLNRITEQITAVFVVSMV